MRKLLLTLIAMSIAFHGICQVIFFEDFDGVGGPTAGGAGTYSFPSGWYLANVDNGTPAANVSYVNEAWERREDFNFNVADSAAFSTSWYNPTGTADDWMWTPPINTLPANVQLSWDAVAYDAAYPDGYEVWVMVSPNTPTGSTGNIGNMVTASTQVFSIAGEASSWTSHSVPLNAYAGQTIRVGFRNHSTDKFLLLIDNVKAEVLVDDDVAILNAASPFPDKYYLTPISQVHAFDTLGAVIINNGVNAATNVALKTDIYKDGVNVFTNTTTPIVSLASGASTPLITPSATFTPTAAGEYSVKYTALMQATDQDLSNDTLSTNSIYVADTTFARENGIVTGSLGIGAGTHDGVIATFYEISQTKDITSVSYYLNPGGDGGVGDQTTRVKIFAYDNTTGQPGSLLYTSAAYTETPADTLNGVLVTLPVSPPLSVTAGSKIYVGIEEFGVSTMTLAGVNDIFTPGATVVNWTGAPTVWGTVESYGSGFAKTYVIRPNFGDVCPTVATTSTAQTCTGNGSAQVTVTGGSGSPTYAWSNSTSNANITNVPAGDYYVTVTDGSCISIDTVNVANNAYALNTGINAVDMGCTTSASASATIANGTSPYTYLWSDASTTSVISPPIGNITVIVTDANGCSGSSSATINNTSVTLTPSVSATNSTCIAADGSATVSVSNGAGPYVYLWSNGNTTTTASNLASGAYNVTVTDANGCSGSASATVNSTSVTLTPSVSTTVSSCATNDGSATVSISNGTSPYVYLWSNGATTVTASNVGAGSYTVSVTDANGCSGTANGTVSTAGGPNATVASATNVSCNGGATGSVDVSVTGGASPLTYLWSNGATTEDISNVVAATYTTTVTDANGCSFTVSSTLTEPAALTETTPVGTNLTCNGDATGGVNISVTGGTAPFSYTWSNGATTEDITGVAAGIYTATVTDANGCTFTTASTTVTEPIALAVTGVVTDASNATATDGAIALTITGGTAPYTTNPSTLTGLAAGQYAVTVTDANGCTTSSNFTVSSSVGINTLAINSINVYPNPTEGNLTVGIELSQASDVQITVLSVTGSIVYAQHLGMVKSQLVNIQLGDLASGIYTMQVTAASETKTSKIILQK